MKRDDYLESCQHCGSSMIWVDCEMCGGEGTDGHDCGEDICVCLYPDDNVACDYCDGRGGVTVCCSGSCNEAGG